MAKMDPVIVGECRMHRFLLFSFGILFLLPKVTLKQYWIYSVSPQCFLLPQFQIMCCYIARYYVKKVGSFPFVPPSLVGAYYLHPPDARAIFSYNDLLCNGTCSVTGGSITYWGGGTNGKDPKSRCAWGA